MASHDQHLHKNDGMEENTIVSGDIYYKMTFNKGPKKAMIMISIPDSQLSLHSIVGQSMLRSPPNLCTLPPGGQSES